VPLRVWSGFREKLSVKIVATALAIAGSVVATGQAPAPSFDPIPYQKDLGSEKNSGATPMRPAA